MVSKKSPITYEHSSPNTTWMIISNRMRLACHVAHRIVVRKPQGKRPFGWEVETRYFLNIHLAYSWSVGSWMLVSVTSNGIPSCYFYDSSWSSVAVTSLVSMSFTYVTKPEILHILEVDIGFMMRFCWNGNLIFGFCKLHFLNSLVIPNNRSTKRVEITRTE